MYLYARQICVYRKIYPLTHIHARDTWSATRYNSSRLSVATQVIGRARPGEREPMSFKALSGRRLVVTTLGALIAVAGTAFAQPAANTYYKVVNKTSAKCVDAAGGGTGNGTVVQQWTCNTNLQQQWLFTATS